MGEFNVFTGLPGETEIVEETPSPLVDGQPLDVFDGLPGEDPEDVAAGRSLQLTEDWQPAAEAKAVKDAQETDAPIEFTRANPKFNKTQITKALETAPLSVKKAFGDLTTATIAKPDLESGQLGTIDKLLTEKLDLLGGLKSGVTGIIGGLVDLPKAVGELHELAVDSFRSTPPALTFDEAERIDTFRRSVEDDQVTLGSLSRDVQDYILSKVGPTKFEQLLSQSGRTMGTMLAFFLAGGGSAVLPGISISAGLGKTTEELRKGTPVDKAYLAGFLSGVTEYLTEKIPLDILRNTATTFFRKLAAGIITDVPGELLSTAVEMRLIEQEALGGEPQSIEAYKQALIDTFLVAVFTTTGTTAPTHAVQKALEKIDSDENDNIKDVDLTSILGDTVEDSEMKKVSPAETENLLKQMDGDTDLNLSSEGLDILYQTDLNQAEDLVRKVGLDPNDVKARIATGQDILIKQSKLFGALTAEERAILLPHIRTGANGFSQQEIVEEVSEENRGLLQEVLVELNTEQLEFTTELDRISEEIAKATGSKEVAAANTTLIDRLANGLILRGGQESRADFLKKIKVQRKKLFRKGSIQFLEDESGNEQILISVFDNADNSTVAHEVGHLFFREMEKAASIDGAPEQLKMDMESLKSWLGVEAGATEFTTEQEEQFARGWEKWLREGKAPTDELETVFTRFKTWLTEVYKRARDLNVNITPEVRRVFNRLIDADTDVSIVAANHNMVIPTTPNMDALGIPSAEQSDLKNLVNQAVEEATVNLQKDRSRAVRKSQGEFAKEAEQEARAEDTRGVYDTITKIKDQVLFNKATGSKEKARLDRQEFIEEYGEEAIKDLPDTGLLINDGIGLDEAAETYGFESGDDMMQAFFETPPLADAIDFRVGLKSEDLANTFKAEDYLANSKKYTDYLIRMGEHLEAAESRARGAEQKGVSRKRITANQLKALAEERMLDLSVVDAQNTSIFLSAMKRAAVALRKAEKAKNYAKAIKENEKMLLNKYMAAASVRNKKRVDAFVARAKRFVKKDKPKSVSLRFRNGIQSLINRFGIVAGAAPRAAVTSKDLLNLFKGNEHIAQFDAPEFLVDDGLLEKPRDYKKMFMREWTALDNSIRFLIKQGSVEQSDTQSDGKTSRKEVALGGMAEMDAQKKQTVFDRYNPWKKISDQSRKQFARMLNLSYITKALGGYKSLRTGVKSFIEEHVVERAKDLRDDQLRRFRLEREKIKPHRDHIVAAQRRIIKEHGRKLFVKDHGVPVPNKLQQNGAQLNYWTPEQVFMLAFNRGNDSNFQALLNGYPGLTQVQVDTLINKYLTVPDMNAVQSILDVFSALAPEADAVHTRLQGYNMDVIKGRSWVFKGKTYKGGYFPLSIDKHLATEANDSFGTKVEEGNFFDSEESRFAVPFAKSTHTLTRKDGHGHPVDLRLQNVDKGLDYAVRYITMAEGIRDIDRIITFSEKVKDDKGNVIGTRGFKQSAVRIMGEDVYAQIRPALKHFVNPTIKGLDTPGSAFVRYLRAIAVPAHIALRTITGVKQLGSISSAIGEMALGEGRGLRAYIDGVMYVTSGPSAAYNTMLDKSAFMLERLKSWERDFLKARYDKMTPAQRELSFGDRNITWGQVKDFGYITVRIPDTVAVTPIWWGSYLDKLNEDGTNEKEAVRYADNIIEDTQPTAQPLDMSAWFREGGFWSLFNLHQTFTVGNYGQRQRTWFRAFKNKEISLMQYARFNFMDAALPLTLMHIAVSVLRGGDLSDPEEQKDILEDILANYALMGLPMAAATYGALTEGWNTPLEVAGAREVEKWTATMRLLFRGFDDMSEKEQERALWGLATMISDILQVPVARVAKQIVQGETLQEKVFKPKNK